MIVPDAIQSSAAPVVYQLRVVLAGISPLIWRRLLVIGDTTIAELHGILQSAFGWSDEHLHRFTIHGVNYGCWRPGSAGFSRDPNTVRLSGFGLRVGERFTYEYDFTDCWSHDIRVEQIRAPRPGKHYPIRTFGARIAPPEDCGGPQAFLALRQRYPQVVTLGRIAEILNEVLDLPDDQAIRGYLAEHTEEMTELQRWARIDEFDRASVNHALTAYAETGGTRS